MDAMSSTHTNEATTRLHAQRACFAPTNRELAPLLQAKYGRGLDAFKASELAVARVVFAQVALMAGAALAADSETYFGAEQLWRDMQDHIGPQERALARHLLELLSEDEYYSKSERRLIGALARALPGVKDQPIQTRSDLDTDIAAVETARPQVVDLSFLDVPDCSTQPAAVASRDAGDKPKTKHIAAVETARPQVIDLSFLDGPASSTQPAAVASRDAGDKPKTKHHTPRTSIKLNDSSVAQLRVQRDSFAPSMRELAQFLQAGHGRGLDAFSANELEIARVVFAQVALMTGAALAADTETYIGAEQLWCDMQDAIGPRERALAMHFLGLLSKDPYYTECERQLIESLAAALPESDEQPLRGRSSFAARPDSEARFCIN